MVQDPKVLHEWHVRPKVQMISCGFPKKMAEIFNCLEKKPNIFRESEVGNF